MSLREERGEIPGTEPNRTNKFICHKYTTDGVVKADVCVLYVQEHKCRMQRVEKGVYCVYHYIDLNGAETGERGLVTKLITLWAPQKRLGRPRR